MTQTTPEPSLDWMESKIKELNGRLSAGQDLTEGEMSQLRRLLDLAGRRREYGYCSACKKPFEFGESAYLITELRLGSSQGYPCAYDFEKGRYHAACFPTKPE